MITNGWRDLQFINLHHQSFISLGLFNLANFIFELSMQRDKHFRLPDGFLSVDDLNSILNFLASS